MLAPGGTPATVVRSWLSGEFELIISDALLGELERALAYPKLRTRIEAAEAQEIIEVLRRSATMIDDPIEVPDVQSADAGDDYLVALAAVAHAAIVSGDHHLLDLADRIPVYAPAEFLALLEAAR